MLLLVVRLVQRSTVQFVFNALFGIGIGWVFVTHRGQRAAATRTTRRWRTSCPGSSTTPATRWCSAFTCLIGWPLVGLHGRQRHRRPDGLARGQAGRGLCTRLTWLLALPCVLRVALQGPIWLPAGPERSTPTRRSPRSASSRSRSAGRSSSPLLAAMLWLLGAQRHPDRAARSRSTWIAEPRPSGLSRRARSGRAAARARPRGPRGPRTAARRRPRPAARRRARRPGRRAGS